MHVLLAHPGEHVRRRPVAAKPHLDEVAPAHRPGLDQPAHRRPVRGEVAVDDVGGVGVRVEVQQAELSPTDRFGDPGRRRPGDGMVTTDDHGDDPETRHAADLCADVAVRRLGLPGRATGVPGVHHVQPVEDLDAEVEMVGAGFVGERAQCPRAEACARSVCGPDVERRADHRDVRTASREIVERRHPRAVTERCQPLVSGRIVGGDRRLGCRCRGGRRRGDRRCGHRYRGYRSCGGPDVMCPHLGSVPAAPGEWVDRTCHRSSSPA